MASKVVPLDRLLFIVVRCFHYSSTIFKCELASAHFPLVQFAYAATFSADEDQCYPLGMG